jgi:hypothetical protein
MNEKQQIMDFWYEFDLFYNPGFGQTPPDIREAYRFESGLLPNWLIDHSQANIKNYPANFMNRINESSTLINSIKLIATTQSNMLNEKLEDNDLLQKAFEYFGQGVLFDNALDQITQLPRRPNGDKIHMMDTLHYGYPRWHVFCRSAVFVGNDKDAWLKIDRLVALGYELHKKLRPKTDQDGKDPQNPEHPEQVEELLPVIMAEDFDQLDKRFDNEDVRSMFGSHL